MLRCWLIGLIANKVATGSTQATIQVESDDKAFAGYAEREGNSNALGLKGEVAEMCACLGGSRRQSQRRSVK